MNITDQLIKGKETIALRVINNCSTCNDFAHIEIDVVYVLPENSSSNETRWNESIGFYDNFYDQKHKYKGLSVTCQMDRNNENPYCWQLHIDNSIGNDRITLERAEEMVKALRPIHRKLNKIAETEGHEKSYEEFVIRIVRALGVKAFYTREENNRQFKLNSDISDLKSHLRDCICKNRNTLGFVTAA
jgi:hypothetical protein